MTSRRQPVTTTTQRTSKYIFKPKTIDGTKYLSALYRIAGISPPNRFKTLYAIYAFVLKVIVFFLVPLMFGLSYVLCSYKLDVQELVSSMKISFGTNSCAVKFAVIVYLRQYLFKIEAILEKLDARIQNSEEKYEVEKVVRRSNRISFAFIISYYTFAASTFIGAVYTKRPLFSSYIPFLDWRESTFELAIYIAIESCLLSVVIFHQLINDMYGIIYTLILQSHLKVLIMRLMRIGTNPSCTQEDNHMELIRCLHDHKNIIELIKTLRVLLSKTYFIQFLATTFCLVATLIYLNICNEKSAIIGSGSYAFCLIIQILPICYIANDLAAEGDRLPEAILHMQWIDQSPEFKRLCLFFMHRSQEPIVFYAGKMFAISLSTFVSIIKFSFSVYTLLSNMNLAERFN